MLHFKSVVVCCGSRSGRNPAFIQAAQNFGELLAQNHIHLIYGAGGTGMMGAVATGCERNGGYVTGATIKQLYDIERPDLAVHIDRMEVWNRLYERKVSMTKQADAIVVLPGGYGTLDELFELLTLKQIGINNVPIILVNIDGFFNTLHQFLFELVGEGYIRPDQLRLLTVVKSIEEVIPEIERQIVSTLVQEPA